MEKGTLEKEQEAQLDEVFRLESGRSYTQGEWTRQRLQIVKEIPLTVFLNGPEFVTLLCTPCQLNQLVMGFLHLEGLIARADDVAFMRVCADDGVADIRLVNQAVVTPTRRVKTSGCTGGVGLSNDVAEVKPVASDVRLTPAQVLNLPKLLRESTRLYPITGGVHGSILTDGQQVLAIAEDVGRHNTVDKLDGHCLLFGISSAARFMVTSGRVSSEMLLKAAKMGVPVVATITSPTHRAVSFAEQLGVTLIGYVRSTTFSVYAHGQRIEGCV